jgi:O-succinylbenzoic acid--CoA ligase
MNIFPDHIQLKSHLIPVRDLLQTSKEKTGWEKEWLDFLAEWYNQEDFIEVQTSGSTGTPKTIRLRKNFVAASAQRTILFFGLKENDRVLHCLPSKYIAGKLMSVRALVGKLDLHVVDPATDFSLLQTQPFRFAAMTPNQVAKLINPQPATRNLEPGTWNLEFSPWNLEFLLIGGSAIPQPLEAKLRHISTICYSSYAMTETATHIALRKINGEGADNFYHCLDDIEVQLSGDGSLRVLMPGLESAFLQTTDLAELKDNKTFRILGRADNVVISGGIKFSPEQLERKLEPYISVPFMISYLPHDTLGQQLVLMVEGMEDAATIFSLETICQQHLDKYEQPRRTLFVPKLPRTANGKLIRKK